MNIYEKIIKNIISSSICIGRNNNIRRGIESRSNTCPHAELLNLVKDDLKAEGVDLKIIEFTDYVTPNLALAEGEIDANFFQHYPYLEKFVTERGLKLVSAAKIHVEPLGVFSKKYKEIGQLPDKATIAIPSDPSNGGRALILLHNNGIITLNDPTNLYVTEFDIVKNPKN